MRINALPVCEGLIYVTSDGAVNSCKLPLPFYGFDWVSCQRLVTISLNIKLLDTKKVFEIYSRMLKVTNFEIDASNFHTF